MLNDFKDARLAQLDRALASGATPYVQVAVTPSASVANPARKSTDLHRWGLTQRPHSRPVRLCTFCGANPIKGHAQFTCSFSCSRKRQAVNMGQKLGTRQKANGTKGAIYSCCIEGCNEKIRKRPYCRQHRYQLKKNGGGIW